MDVVDVPSHGIELLKHPIYILNHCHYSRKKTLGGLNLPLRLSL